MAYELFSDMSSIDKVIEFLKARCSVGELGPINLTDTTQRRSCASCQLRQKVVNEKNIRNQMEAIYGASQHLRAD